MPAPRIGPGLRELVATTCEQFGGPFIAAEIAARLPEFRAKSIKTNVHMLNALRWIDPIGLRNDAATKVPAHVFTWRGRGPVEPIPKNSPPRRAVAPREFTSVDYADGERAWRARAKSAAASHPEWRPRKDGRACFSAALTAIEIIQLRAITWQKN